jgi:transcriptional regulator with XRE-family HTH domain
MNRLKAVRFLCQMSQDRLAQLVKIDRSKISRFECGYIKPRDDERKKIAEVLKEKEDVLFPER